MPEKFVTVARFSQPLEAELAKARLADAGIEAYVLGGDLVATTFSGMGGLGGRVYLQVPESVAQQAEVILAACAPETPLDPDWESQAEDDEAVWVCTLCGDAVRDALPVCPSCLSPRGADPETSREGDEAVQDSPALRGRHRRARPLASKESVQKQGELTSQTPLTPDHTLGSEDVEVPPLATLLGDDMARRAFLSALFGCVLPIGIFTLYSAWVLVGLLFYPGELSPAGNRKVIGAYVLNAGAVVLSLGVYSRSLYYLLS
jgi:hypothetical protein